jgi:hypothetical protein
MKTFETFLIEVDEMSLDSRMASGQINQREKDILAQRRAARAKLGNNSGKPETSSSNNSALAIRKPESPSSGAPVNKPKPIQKTAVTPSPIAKADPQGNSLMNRVKKKVNLKGRLSTAVDKKIDRTLDSAVDSVVGLPGNIAKAGLSLVKRGLNVPKVNVGVDAPKELAGPTRLGVATR